MPNQRSSTGPTEVEPDVDVLVIGAGFAGMYMLQRLRGLGMSTLVVEAGPEVGGTWFWNRYPGLRCDIPTTDYAYSWDPELESEWQWSEKYATQPEILRYLQHVATKHDLRRDIRFSTRIAGASWDDGAQVWRVTTDTGDTIIARHVVMATGALSVPKSVDIPGVESFAGETYSTARWPEGGVDFSGKRVAVIGTGSSGIQVIPFVAEQADELVVFQRTPAFSLPAQNGAAPEYRTSMIAEDRDAYRDAARWSSGGYWADEPAERAEDFTRAEQLDRLERAWQAGEFAAIINVFADQLKDKSANDVVADFIREKIRSIVEDPVTADALCPADFPFATKRPCFDTDYYATYNRPNVSLVDLRKHPITTITETGIVTADGVHELDAIVFATGYDALTGAVLAVDLTGRDGVTLKERWEHGPATYLGIMSANFPNLFLINGPGSPSVLSNMIVSIEQHVDWIADSLEHLRAEGFTAIEPTLTAEEGWAQHVNDCADITLFPTANSWYVGANVPGKPRVFMPYVGGVGVYRATCDDVVARGYLGFTLTGPGKSQCNDGVVNRLQPDVAELVRDSAAADAPPLESLPIAEVRGAAADMAAQKTSSKDLAEVREAILPGPTGDIAYRLYRPRSEGPRPIVVYFHGGGWVLGDLDSDDALCRDLSVRSQALVISIDYRRAPEDPFPAALDDATAALRWVSAHAPELWDPLESTCRHASLSIL